MMEIGIPVVIAVNMMDLVRKNGDEINIENLSKSLGCKMIEISALKGEGVMEAAQMAIDAAYTEKVVSRHLFSGEVEHALAHIEEAVVHDMPLEQQRWYAIKIFERDPQVGMQLKIDKEILRHIEEDIKLVETIMDDDAEAIITNERYEYITRLTGENCKKKNVGGLTTSDKIDRIVTNRWLALPIFVAIMFVVYFVSVTTVGTWASSWANEGLFGEGWHLLGSGSAQYEAAVLDFAEESLWTDDVVTAVEAAAESGIPGAEDILVSIEDKDFDSFVKNYETYGEALDAEGFEITEAVDEVMVEAPEKSDYGVWIAGVPVAVASALDSIGCAEWLKGLIVDGIIAGVGAVLGFVPQMFVLFAFLAFLEACGYMSRVAFVMDRIFRKFGLSGKSFIPMLIGSGCGVPGIMASRTIENLQDRRMTIITTTFIPCGAKLPVIALIAAALFDGSAWVATSAYFLGIAAVVISGIILKKTKPFRGEVSPFVMELPAYHMPTAKNILLSMWERGWDFIKRAGTVILIASMAIWAGASFGVAGGRLVFNPGMALEDSLIGAIGGAICWIFTPIGFGTIKAAVATIMGLLAKEEIVGVFGVLDFAGFSALGGYTFLIFNLLCAPCFAAMATIKREMHSGKWTAFAISYQCCFAYCVSLIIYQFGLLISGNVCFPGLGAAIIVSILLIYLLFRRGRN